MWMAAGSREVWLQGLEGYGFRVERCGFMIETGVASGLRGGWLRDQERCGFMIERESGFRIEKGVASESREEWLQNRDGCGFRTER